MPSDEIDKTNLICPHFSLVGTPTFSLAFAHRLCAAVSQSHTTDPIDLTCEMDSHADTCCVGRNFVKFREPDRYITVSPFSEEYKPLERIPVTTTATVWTDAHNNSYLLLFHESLFFGDRLSQSLICPNQLRSNGLIVHDVPRQFDPYSTHSIRIPDADLTIPLEMSGVISGFATTKPTPEELESLPRIVMTADSVWHPHSSTFAAAEEKANASNASAVRQVDPNSIAASCVPRLVAAVRSYDETYGYCMELENDEDELCNRLVAAVRVSHPPSAEDTVDIEDLDPDEYFLKAVKSASSRPTKAVKVLPSSSKTVLDPQTLSSRWNVGLTKAKKTLQVTTQAGVRNVLVPSERKVRKKAPWLKFPNVKGRWFCDEMFSKCPSLDLHTGASVFTDGKGYDFVYPWKSKKQHPEGLMSLIQNVGIPQTLISDGAQELFHGRSREICNEYRIKQEVTVPYSQWQNAAEASIRELKKGVIRKLRQTGAPRRTWSYALKWVASVRQLTASDIPELNGRTPFEHVLGSTPDISPMALFDFYQPVYYYTPSHDFPHERKCIGRWLGLADDCIDDMAFNVLTEKGRVIVRKDVWAIPDDDMKNPTIRQQLEVYDGLIKTLLVDTSPSSDEDTANVSPDPPDDFFGEDESESLFPAALDSDTPLPDADDYTPEELDEYLTAEVMLPHGGDQARAKIIGRSKDEHGRPIGKRDPNPILDTRFYDVLYPDGSTESLAANLIAENLYSQVDTEGNSYAIVKDIIGHRKTKDAVLRTDPDWLNGRKRHTTVGWEHECELSDGSTVWIPLKDLKNDSPVQLAEYAVAAGLAKEPAYAWWVPHTLRKRGVILAKVKSCYWKRTHKYGIELPKTVQEALEIDRRTGTDFWRKAIEKEMKNVRIAFEFRDDDKVPIGYKHIPCHMVFDIKSDLRRKARLVAGGHKTDPPKESTYSSVVSRDSVRIAFTIAALNCLDVLAGDVQNAYLNAPTKERTYITAGLEFGPENVGRPALIVRALYGLKSSAARWRDHIAATLREMKFNSCLADPDVWLRPQVRPSDGFQYYEYVLVYIDDILCVSHDPRSIMNDLEKRYTIKPESIKDPDEYLGSEIRHYTIPDTDDPENKPRWAMSSDKYVKRAISEIETELSKVGQKLQTRVSTPLATGYRPEIDSSPELDPRRANYYQGLIGILRWVVELGRIDIIVAVSQLSRYLAMPREGHLEQALHIFAYLKAHGRSTLVFDDTTPTFDEDRFFQADWSEYYPDASDPLPPNMPPPRGRAVTTTCFVDADHAGCLATRRSQTGILMFLQRAPILWYSKRQSTVETSTFGSEFVAMKTAIEQIEGFRYKLRMMGIPLDGETNVFCDNESVFKSATMPEVTLKKKHNAIAYHRTREAQAANIVRIAWEEGETNLADLLTKSLPGPRLRFLAQRVLW